MFGKKKNSDLKRQQLLEDEIITEEENELIEEIVVPVKEKTKKIKRNKTNKKKEPKLPIEIQEITDKEVQLNFVWYDKDIECEPEEITEQKPEVLPEPVIEDIVEVSEPIKESFDLLTEDNDSPIKEPDDNREEIEPVKPKLEDKPKKDLREYFTESKEENKKLKIDKKEKKKRKSKKSRKEKREEEIIDQRYYKFKKKKYTKVEDFIKYLDDHYLDIEDISREVLDSKNFYGWISKRSGVFEQSLKQFKEIQNKIENK